MPFGVWCMPYHKSWTSCEKIVKNLWTSYEKVVNEEVKTAKLWTCHEQVVYKLRLISPEQVIDK